MATLYVFHNPSFIGNIGKDYPTSHIAGRPCAACDKEDNESNSQSGDGGSQGNP